MNWVFYMLFQYHLLITIGAYKTTENLTSYDAGLYCGMMLGRMQE